MAAPRPFLVTLALALTVPACSHTVGVLPEGAAPVPAHSGPRLDPPPPPRTESESPALPEEAIRKACADGDWLNRERLHFDLDLMWEDHKHYYSGSNLAAVALGIAAAAPLANTSADRDIRQWYQERVRRDGLDTLSDVVNYGGQLWVAVPICMEAAAVTGLMEGGSVHDGGFHEWSHRSLRAAAVGYPPVIALYFLLGSERPAEGDSRWRPFHDWHGVSGHTFIGAIPFLTAAAMTDDPCLKVPLFLGSFLTGWSRIHDDEHYFSQVALGWWLAYLAVRSVDQTQDSRALTITPTLTPDGPGVSVLYQY